MTRTALVIRELRAPLADAQPSIVMGPLGEPEGPALAMPLPAVEAHTLYHELHGQQTPRSHAMGLLGRVVDALGGRLRAARLERDENHQLAGTLEIETANGVVEIEVCATQALAVAARLGVPLLADAELLAHGGPRSELESAVADIVNGLRD